MRHGSVRHLVVFCLALLVAAPSRAQTVPTPEQFSASRSALTASWPATRRSSNTSRCWRNRPTASSSRCSARRRWVTTMRCCGSARRRTSRSFDRLVEINRRLADPRGLSDARGAEAGGRRQAVLSALRHHPLDRGLQRSGHHPHRPPPGHRELAACIREMLDNAVVLLVPSQNPDGQHLVIDHWYKTKGTQLRARLSGPVPQVRRPRRQPRLVHVHAEGNAHEHRAGAEQVQADHLARHAPAGPGQLAHLRAAVHRSVRRRTSIRSWHWVRRRSARRWRRR